MPKLVGSFLTYGVEVLGGSFIKAAICFSLLTWFMVGHGAHILSRKMFGWGTFPCLRLILDYSDVCQLNDQEVEDVVSLLFIFFYLESSDSLKV